LRAPAFVRRSAKGLLPGRSAPGAVSKPWGISGSARHRPSGGAGPAGRELAV